MKIWFLISLILGLATGLASRVFSEPEYLVQNPSEISPSERNNLTSQPSPDLNDNSVSPETLEKVGFVERIPTLTAGEIDNIWRNKPSDHRLRTLLLRRWCEVAPEAALETVKNTDLEWHFWKAWGRIDGEAAFHCASEKSQYFLSSVLEGIAQKDPHHALAILEENGGFPNDLAPPSVLGTIVSGLAKDDWEAALEFQVNRHRYRHASIIFDWSAAEPERALIWLASNQHAYDKKVAREIAAQVAEKNPQALKGGIAGSPTGEIKQLYLDALKKAEN
jgi:hypothetical protein